MDILGLISIPGWLLGILIIVVALYLYGYRQQTTFKRLGLPGPVGWPYVGQLGRVKQNGLFRNDVDLVSKYGKCFGVCLGNHPLLYVTHLEMIKEICVKDFHNFSTRGKAFGSTKFWKMAVTNADGEHWRFLRSILSPTFTTGKLRSMDNICQKCLSGFTQNIERNLEQSETVDLRKIFEGLTMDMICSTSMGIDVDSQNNPKSPFVVNARKLMTLQFAKNLIIVAILCFPGIDKLLDIFDVDMFDTEAVEFIRASTKEAVEERRRGGKSKFTDALQLMVNTCKDSEENKKVPSSFEEYKERGMTETEIIANAATFLIAGFDTTASTLMWMAYYLALNQDCQEKLSQEVRSVIGSSAPSYDHLASMEYLDMCMNETLRLNPPSSRTTREADRDTVIGDNLKVKKGMTILFPIYALHRMPEYWPDPEKFDPERFSPENKDSILPYSYMPFGVGPRNCIGMRMAMMEVKLAIATLLQCYRLQVSPKTMVPIEYEENFFVKPKGELWLNVERR